MLCFPTAGICMAMKCAEALTSEIVLSHKQIKAEMKREASARYKAMCLIWERL